MTRSTMASNDGEAEADIAMDFEHTPVAEPLTNEDSSRKMCCHSLWQGQYCCVPMCHHSFGKLAERMRLENSCISFHSFPNLTTEKESTTVDCKDSAGSW